MVPLSGKDDRLFLYKNTAGAGFPYVAYSREFLSEFMKKQPFIAAY
jgi:hypothetical protein